jgi:hypothetical protein
MRMLILYDYKQKRLDGCASLSDRQLIQLEPGHSFVYSSALVKSARATSDLNLPQFAFSGFIFTWIGP